ncbi:cyclic pyranopterin monophosphate synthase MoaC [Thermosipho ferrireducens]|uniref:Cyclic pyranopterin monophosphate synthase n=1 Tax=Thermosipho ferrireducens TaxID=2571116 RepID=A0ABX7S908_9BACT|nr:cyclic pyranopterin monophosphate synthase MoaC [Thermosipho ferrireducens]QTA38361.1 cyclic pyranopterin monophosphate synthase MoaC [Thermosipho ferrireducens]
MEFSHIDKDGKAKMVNVGGKADTKRTAVAYGKVTMRKETLNAIINDEIPKGDVFTVAKVAGIMAAKNTSSIIPMCHNIFLTGVDINFESKIEKEKGIVEIFARVNTIGKTGAEMEALTAVSVAALTLYDMCKSVDKMITIENIYLMEKFGGKSGHWRREDESLHNNS